MNPRKDYGKIPIQVVLSGVTMLLVIASVSFLHTNQYEFFYLRFSGLNGIVFGPMLAGIVTDIGNFALCFVVAGIVELVSLGVYLFLIRKLHRPLRLSSFQYLRTKDRKEVHSAGKQNDI